MGEGDEVDEGDEEDEGDGVNEGDEEDEGSEEDEGDEMDVGDEEEERADNDRDGSTASFPNPNISCNPRTAETRLTMTTYFHLNPNIRARSREVTWLLMFTCL